LVLGSRVLLLSPHPGRVRAELNAHAYGLHSQGSAAFQSAARRVHDLLFDVAPAEQSAELAAERAAA
jgi:NitT/TauT family transport system ATP-binding protein